MSAWRGYDSLYCDIFPSEQAAPTQTLDQTHGPQLRAYETIGAGWTRLAATKHVRLPE